MNRAGEVYYEEILAGLLTESEEGYRFVYDAAYLSEENPAITLTMPLRQEAYESRILFPFFDGLIPEGWLLEIAVQSWKFNPRDRMGLLLAVCEDCLGAVSIRKIDSTAL